MSGEIINNINHLDLNNCNEQNDDVVDPWTVVSKSDTGVDYNKLTGELEHCLTSQLKK